MSWPLVWPQLHALSHIDHAMKPVSNRFVAPQSSAQITTWNTTPYQQSIQSFAIIMLISGLIILIIKTCSVCTCFMTRYIDEERKLSYPCWIKVFRFLFVIIGLVFGIIALKYGMDLNDNLKVVEKDVQSTQVTVQTMTNAGNTATAAINNLTLGVLDPTIRSQFQKISSDLAEYTAIAASPLLSKLKIDQDVRTVRQNLFTVTIITLWCIAMVFIILALYEGMSIRSIIKTPCNNSIFEVLVFIFCLAIVIVVSVEFAASVQVADACADPNDAVLQIMNNSRSTNSSVQVQALNALQYQAVKYYIYCDAQNEVNPLANFVVTANTAVIAVEPAFLIYLLTLPIAQQGPLRSNYQQLKSSLGTLTLQMTCNSFHAQYSKTVTDTCHSTLGSLFLFYVFAGLVTAVTVIREFFLCVKAQFESEDVRDSSVSVQQTELTEPAYDYHAMEDPKEDRRQVFHI